MKPTVSITRDLALLEQPLASASICDALASREVLAASVGNGVEFIVVGRDEQPLASAVLDLDVARTTVGDTMDLPASGLQHVAWVSDVRRAAGPVGERAQSLALYAALQRARLAGRHQIGATVVDDSTPLSRLLALVPLAKLPIVDLPGRGSFRPHAQRLDIALARTFAAAQSSEDPVAPSFLVREVDAFMQGYFEKMWQTKWFLAVEHRTLTRTQYVYTLSNMHQFVRFTTRILARCVAAADDSQLRLHFLRHLQGEVNHELIIERDLTALGEDVEFVVERMSPNLATRQFMAAQESAIAFHRDPILLMAAPLAAEGISGHLDQSFMNALHESVARWGVLEPERVTRFYSSHIDFDGGDDGHWAGTMAMLAAHLRDETALARFMSMLRVTTDAMLRCYDSWIDEMPVG